MFSALACFKAVATKNSRSAVYTAAHYGLSPFTSAVPSVRASGRPAVGHLVPDFVAADQASDLVDRPGFAGRLGLECSCRFLSIGIEVNSEHPGRLLPISYRREYELSVTGNCLG